MRRAAVVAMLAVGSAIMAGLLHVQGPSVELGITTSDAARVVAALGVQPASPFGLTTMKLSRRSTPTIARCTSEWRVEAQLSPRGRLG